MKRLCQKIIVWFVNWFNKVKIEEKISFGIALILAICICACIFKQFDITPATEQDFLILEQQMYEIGKKPELLLNTKCTITPEENTTKVYIDSDECSLNIEYDKEFKVQSYERVEKCYKIIDALAITLVLFVVICAFGSVIILGIFFAIKDASKAIYKKIKKM